MEFLEACAASDDPLRAQMGQKKLEEAPLLTPGTYEETIWSAYSFVLAVASDSMGGVDMARGLELYFSEDQPGEFVTPTAARLVRSLLPWLRVEDLIVRDRLEKLKRGPD